MGSTRPLILSSARALLTLLTCLSSMTASSVGVLGPFVSWPSSLLLMSLLATKLESGGTCPFDNSKETISREFDKNFSKISRTDPSRIGYPFPYPTKDGLRRRGG